MRLNEGWKDVGTINNGEEEVVLRLACGVPTLKSSKNGSMCVSVMPEKNATMPFHGYCFHETAMWEIINHAIENKLQLVMRFEKQRKKDVDKSIPMAELTKDIATGLKYVRYALVGIYDFNNQKWITNSNLINPDNDPADVSNFLAYCQANSEEVSPDEFFTQKVKATSTPVISNPSTFDRQQQLLTMYFFVCDCEKKYEFTLQEDKRMMVANKLLRIADEIQKHITKSDVVDYKSYAHTRARFMLFSYESHVNNLDESGLRSFGDWLKSCLATSTKLLDWAEEN